MCLRELQVVFEGTLILSNSLVVAYVYIRLRGMSKQQWELSKGPASSKQKRWMERLSGFFP